MLNNQFNIPLPMAVWLANDEYLYAKYSNEISTTTLLKSPRYIIQTRREMYPEAFDPSVINAVLPNQTDNSGNIILPDIQDVIAARVGTAIHSAVEKAWLTNHKQCLKLLGYPEDIINNVVINPEQTKEGDIPVYLENRMYREIEVEGQKFIVSGQYDFIVNGNLHDIKTTSTYSYESGCNDEKYMLQGSIYRWLSNGLITGDELTINFLFTDWKRFTANGTKEKYPPAKAYYKKYKLLSLSETEAYIKNKLKAVVQHWNNPVDVIPCCTEKDLFTKPSVFKYYKDGYAEGKRSSKNFESFAEASKYRAEKAKFQGEIIEHKPEPFMCPYCNPVEVANMLTETYQPLEIIIE